MIRWLLRLFGYCDHAHRYREFDADRVLWLVCEACGHRVPAIRRTIDERRDLRAKWPRAQPPP